MDSSGNPFTPEQVEPEKSRFEEKSDDSFRCQRRPEDITHITGILRPVGTKLEFHNDTGSYTQSESECQNAREEVGNLTRKKIITTPTAPLQQHQQPG